MVTTPKGYLVGLIGSAAYGGEPVLFTAVRRHAIIALEEAGLIELGDDEEQVPEYEGHRPGLRWGPGRTGRRITLTESGRQAAKPHLPMTEEKRAEMRACLDEFSRRSALAGAAARERKEGRGRRPQRPSAPTDQ
jgi:hypothetical protein